MKVVEYFSSEDKKHWLKLIGKADENVGEKVSKILKNGEETETYGAGVLFPMLIDEEKIAAFCFFGPQKQIQPSKHKSWISNIYVYPEYRGTDCLKQLLDWCESVASALGRENAYIATTENGVYEKFGYFHYKNQPNTDGEGRRIYRKNLRTDGVCGDNRGERGAKWKAEVVKAAQKGIDMTSFCGFSCKHCPMGESCGGCKSFFNCCSYGTCFDDNMCPNVKCCREKGINGCYECVEVDFCEIGFFAKEGEGISAKAQAMFIKKYGKQEHQKVLDNLSKKFDAKRIQEMLGFDIDEALDILEENR